MKVIKIFKFFKKGIKPMEKKKARKLYTQALSFKTNKILKIKEMFLKLPANKIDNIYRIINEYNKPKPKLNMTTKRLSRKQVIILISNDNKVKFIELSSSHIANLNRALKNIKLNIIADFVHMNQANITIVTDKVMSSLYLQTIEKYVKNFNHINLDGVNISHLPQLKFYLKIISILYLVENTNIPILLDIVEEIIKNNHIFNNITVASRPHIIKVSSKLDIQNIQSNTNVRAKNNGLIFILFYFFGTQSQGLA